jgi:SpoVK/Ycf46/Vps4 family AAA+-type ATPase
LRKPLFSSDFPSKILTTGLDWGDLILDEHSAKKLDEIKILLDYGSIFLNEWGMAAKIKPGYKTLFYGSPGTGKTLTAALLGKLFHLDVYRIDLSMVVSKYIGETEKNLEKVFSKAENKNWILFFDEADALFGKRTGIADAHDKYANQEIAYLLQRLEDYPGLVILASNMRHNVDEAFTRRLQSVIYFKKPQAKERFILWKNSFSEQCEMPNDEALRQLAEQYEITGGGIVNAVQYASLMALSRHEQKIALEDVITGVKKEFSKEGKTL